MVILIKIQLKTIDANSYTTNCQKMIRILILEIFYLSIYFLFTTHSQNKFTLGDFILDL